MQKILDIINDNTDKWTNKDKINAMKLVIEASRTKFDILLNGSVNLTVENTGLAEISLLPPGE